MPPAKKADGKVHINSKGEVLRFKSPAEFFSENKVTPPHTQLSGSVLSGCITSTLHFWSCDQLVSISPPCVLAMQNIAGFDNPGKSLYTTIRELVENSLDACESISVLPDIQIEVQELDGAELNKVLGIVSHERLDSALFEGNKTGGKKKAATAAAAAAASRATPPTLAAVKTASRARRAAGRRRTRSSTTAWSCATTGAG